MTDANSHDEPEESEPEPEASETALSPSDSSDGDVTLKEIVMDMPETASRDDVKRNVLKITMLFASVGLGFLFIVFAFAFNLQRLASGDGVDVLENFKSIYQMVFALLGVVLVAILNPMLLSGLIGFEFGNKIEDLKSSVTVSTVGSAAGVIALVVILVGGSIAGFTVLVPDETQDLGAEDGMAEDDGLTSVDDEATEADETEGKAGDDDDFSLSSGMVLLLFTGLAGGISGGGSAYATKKYGIDG